MGAAPVPGGPTAMVWDYGLQICGISCTISMGGGLSLPWESAPTLGNKHDVANLEELKSHCPASSRLDGPCGRWTCILRHCKASEACFSGCVSMAQYISVLQIPSPGLSPRKEQTLAGIYSWIPEALLPILLDSRSSIALVAQCSVSS